MVPGWNRSDNLLVQSINLVHHGYCSGFICLMFVAVLCLFFIWSFFSGHFLHASKKKRRACLSLMACGFKHFTACNLGLICLIVIGLVRYCVSHMGRFSFSSVKSSYLLFCVNTKAPALIHNWFIIVGFCV